MAARTKIIAELASNHAGNPQLLRDMIDAAAQAGADFVKVQLYDASVLHEDDTQKQWLAQAQVTPKLLDIALKTAKENKVELVASVFGIPQAQMAKDAGLTTIKIGSGDSIRPELVEEVYRLFAPVKFNQVWLSCGIWPLTHRTSSRLTPSVPVVVVPFHGVSQYPTPYVRGLSRLLQSDKSSAWGWSDHGDTLEVAKEAILYGATYVERHFTTPFRTGARRSAWDSEADGIRELRTHAENCAWEGTELHKAACDQYLTRWTGQ